MGHAKPNPRELARRRKIRKFWADHPEKSAAQSERQKEVWADKERRDAKSKEQKQFWVNHPEKSAAQSKRQKRVMRSSKRREINSATMMRLKAHPEFEARRLAGIAKAEATPERKTLRRGTLAKTLAKPAVRRRRIKNSKKATATHEYRAAMSARKKKLWAGLRAGQAALAKIVQHRRLGRPRMDEWYGSAAILHRQGVSYRECARQKDPEFEKDPDAATLKMRIGIRRWERSHK